MTKAITTPNLITTSIMNLWVRTFRQLPVVVAALFFFSCEDETSLLGYPNPNKKFGVNFIEIPLDVSSVLVVDSVITDLRRVEQTSYVDGLLVGAYDDPSFGRVEAKSFMTIYPLSASALPENAVFDSVTVQFRLNFFAYGGDPGMQTRRFAVHELTGDTLTFFDGNRYYANTEGPAYSAEPLGHVTVRAHYDSLFKQSQATTNRDTVLARGRLSDTFGMKLFNALSSTVDYQEFIYNVKGLVAVADEPAGILGFNVIDPSFGGLSRVDLHYHTLDDEGAVDDTLSRGFGFNYTSYAQIMVDRMASPLAGAQPYMSFEPADDNRYIQSGGAPVATKIDLSPFYAFADTVPNLLINEAEFVIEGVASESSLRPHQQLMIRLLKNDKDEFLNNKVAADRELGSSYYVSVSGVSPYITVASEGASTTALSYDASKSRYSGFVTLFAQSLYRASRKTEGERLQQIALYPAQPQDARSVARTVFDKNNVKLRIVYTRPANTAVP